MQSTVFRRARSIAGAALVGLGTFILYHNLAGLVAWGRNILGSNSSQTLGIPAAVIQAFGQVWQSYGVNHQLFLEGSLQHMWIFSWPLLLVTFGSVLSRDDFAADVVAPSQKKNCIIVDSAPHRSTSK
jgi:hypothetical protein